jgi:penicillin-binding protein 1C
MQLAGQLDGDLQAQAGGRSLRQKWDQMRAAQAIEDSWSKAQIFEAYLNLVSFAASCRASPPLRTACSARRRRA